MRAGSPSVPHRCERATAKRLPTGRGREAGRRAHGPRSGWLRFHTRPAPRTIDRQRRSSPCIIHPRLLGSGRAGSSLTAPRAPVRAPSQVSARPAPTVTVVANLETRRVAGRPCRRCSRQFRFGMKPGAATTPHDAIVTVLAGRRPRGSQQAPWATGRHRPRARGFVAARYCSAGRAATLPIWLLDA